MVKASLVPRFPLWGAEKTKALAHMCQDFYFVDKRFEISNLDLIRDIKELIKLADSFSDFPSSSVINGLH